MRSNRERKETLDKFYNSFLTIPIFEIELYKYGLSDEKDKYVHCHVKYDKKKDELQFGKMNYSGFEIEGTMEYIDDISMNRNLDLLFYKWIEYLKRNL